jgi:Peptidase family M1 domain
VTSRGYRAAGAVSVALAALGVAATAEARPRAFVAVNQIQALPAHAAAGSVHRLRGVATNSGRRAASGRVTVRLLHRGAKPRAIGHAKVRVKAHGSRRFTVSVRVPAGLKKGSYQLAACAPRGVAGGWLTCATGASEFKVAGGDAVRGPVAARQAAPALAADDTCSSCAHTLAPPGDKVYPEGGNGGYKSVHTDTHLIFDAPSSLFLAGTYADQTILATQCLSDFSFDFERQNNYSDDDGVLGPDMTVSSVTINGQPATFTFVQPTYPGDPNGQNDPDPLAHQASNSNPVSASNPNPPACSPRSNAAADQGVPCPANKLVVTPAAPIPSGQTVTVRINYSGRPGVHEDGDGSQEGWFRNGTDGSFVTTEPMGTMAWLPLNNHPTAKPTYDFTTITNPDRTAISNGALVSNALKPADSDFADPTTGAARDSITWKWHSPEPVQNYLVENSVGLYDNGYAGDPNLQSGAKLIDGILFYEFQASHGIPTRPGAPTPAQNKAIMDQQADITRFQSTFNGPFPFSTNGVIVGVPNAGFEEEMQTKITFASGSISLGTFHHENMHQWWGDNVAESLFRFTFLKEGMANLGSSLATARTAGLAAGAEGTPAYQAAFDTNLIGTFNSSYASNTLWTAAPSNPNPNTLFNQNFTYRRPATSYIALRQILGPNRWIELLKATQHDFGGGNISEAQMEAQYKKFIPNQSAACQAKLDTFFTQWWDTAYPAGGGANKPQITGPGLAGPGFYDATGACSKQLPPVSTLTVTGHKVGDWYGGTPRPTLVLSATDGGTRQYNLDGAGFVNYTGPVTLSDGTHTVVYRSLDAQGNQEGDRTETIKVDATGPVTTATTNPPLAGGAVANGTTVTLSAVDALNGVASTEYQIDGNGFRPYTAPFLVTGGGLRVVQFRSTDTIGNVEATQTLNVLVQPAVDGTVSGSVPATLALSLGGPATFGPFTAGVANDYTADMTATVISTAGDAVLSVTDPSATATGRLVNGTFALAQPLQARASSAGGTGSAFAPLSTTAGSPLNLLAYGGPKSNDAVTVQFRQSIGANEPLRTGSYAKTLTFTLATTTP